MTKKELKELKELGYGSEEEYLEEILGLDQDYTLEDYMDSWDPD